MAECPICKTEFNMEVRGGVCPKGHPHPDANEPNPNPSEECPECGAELKPDDAFCTNCGEEIPPPEPKEDRCPNCGKKDVGDAKFCPECGTSLEPEPQPDPTPDKVLLKSDGGEVVAEDGKKIGAELRNAAVNSGSSKDDARKIHREHVQFHIEPDNVVMEVIGVNPTVHNGETLSEGDRVEIKEGDTIEFSRVLETTVRFG